MQKYKLFGEVSGLPFFLLWQPCQYHLLALILSIFWFYRTAIIIIFFINENLQLIYQLMNKQFNNEFIVGINISDYASSQCFYINP